MPKNIFSKDGVPTLKLTSEADVNDFVLIDVRRPDEFNGELGHIKGAKLVTLGPELSDFINKMDKSKPTLFICRSGMRSATATMMAKDVGCAEVFNMEGGMMMWNELGFKTEA
jgi:rhodanese-related sulfurtransferase